MQRKRLTKPYNKLKVGLTEELLSRYYASPLTFAQTKQQMFGFIVGPTKISQKQLYKTITRVSQQGWLEKKVIEDGIYYCLTAKGRVRYLIGKLKRMRKPRAEQATIIIFDIPEEKRTFRNFLRRLLKDMKFTQIQKSVLIAPYVLPQEFYDLLKEMDLLRFTKVIEGKLKF